MLIVNLLLAQPLSADAFEMYGDVIELGQPTLQRLDPAAYLDNRRSHATPSLAVGRADAMKGPFVVKAFERHPYSSQLFIPTALSRYLLVVAPTAPDGSPQVSECRAFVASGRQAVNYAAGTWHQGMTILDRRGEYVVLRWNDGTEDDVEFRSLDQPIPVGVPNE